MREFSGLTNIEKRYHKKNISKVSISQAEKSKTIFIEKMVRYRKKNNYKFSTFQA